MTDPETEWDTARDFLAALLQPWIPAGVIPDIVTSFVTGYMTAAGWQPPVTPPSERLRHILDRAGDIA